MLNKIKLEKGNYVGEYVICKKDLFDSDKNKIILIKNKKYKITSTGVLSIYTYNPCIMIKTENRYNLPFFLQLKNYDYHFYEYFYTEQEYRKLKLEKLNESR